VDGLQLASLICKNHNNECKKKRRKINIYAKTEEGDGNCFPLPILLGLLLFFPFFATNFCTEYYFPFCHFLCCSTMRVLDRDTNENILGVGEVVTPQRNFKLAI